MTEARSVVGQIEAQIAAAREQRVAAIAVQSADGLNAANQRLRELPAELAFAQQAALEAEIALHDGQACALAADMWAAGLRVEAAVATSAAAKQEHDAAVNASRVLYGQHRGHTQRAEQLRTELSRQVAALSAVR